jgi:hypothetical protein
MPSKKHIFFYIIFFLLTQQADCQPDASLYTKADQLFEQKKYFEASKLYYGLLKHKTDVPPNVLLKLAYISEKNADISKSLYFLNLYFERHPTDVSLKKMNDLALKYGMEGYELSDFYIFLLLIKQYFYILMALGIALGLYVVLVFVSKKRKAEPILLQQKIVLFLYLSFLFGLLMMRGIFKQGIVHKTQTSLRVNPSAAAEPVFFLENGHRLTVLGADDVWLRVLYQNKIFYAHKSNIWLVN